MYRLYRLQELYGAERTSTITAALSRLFTAFLQRIGFTCGMSDVLLLPGAEAARVQILKQADVRCLDAAATYVGVLGPLPLVEGGMGLVSGGCLGWEVHGLGWRVHARV
jgi:hypothetical protein